MIFEQHDPVTDDALRAWIDHAGRLMVTLRVDGREATVVLVDREAALRLAQQVAAAMHEMEE